MGMLLPLLALPLIIGFMKHAARRKHFMMGDQHAGHAGWENGVPPMFAELHRRAHAAEAKAAEAKPETV
jgi:hypothetical protein